MAFILARSATSSSTRAQISRCGVEQFSCACARVSRYIPELRFYQTHRQIFVLVPGDTAGDVILENVTFLASRLRNMARNNHFLETGQPDVSKIAQPTRNRCQRWNRGIKTESKGGTGKQEHDQPNLLHLPRSKPRRHAAQTVHLNQPHAASVARATRKWQGQPKLSQLLREST